MPGRQARANLEQSLVAALAQFIEDCSAGPIRERLNNSSTEASSIGKPWLACQVPGRNWTWLLGQREACSEGRKAPCGSDCGWGARIESADRRPDRVIDDDHAAGSNRADDMWLTSWHDCGLSGVDAVRAPAKRELQLSLEHVPDFFLLVVVLVHGRAGVDRVVREHHVR